MEYVEIPAWAIRLKLMREGNYTLTDRGRLLNILASGAAADTSGNERSKTNPFIVSDAEKFIFLYSLLEADGDVFRGLYRELSHVGVEVDLGTVRELTLGVLKRLAGGSSSTRGRVFSSPESKVIPSMIKTLERGSDQIVVSRIEPFVDCGIVSRTNRHRYTYRLAQAAQQFLRFMDEYSTVDDFLERGLGKATFALLGALPVLFTGDIRHYIATSYLKMRSGLGYCSIRELSILAVSAAIDDRATCFEIDDVENELSAMSAEYGARVRFTKNRQGRVAMVRIDRRLAESLNGSGLSS